MGIRDKIREYIEISEVSEIARRYFVMNAFDGVLTILGVVIGAYVSGCTPDVVVKAGISGSLAMGISGISGAYMAEKAERTRELKKLESALLISLKDTIPGRASKFATFYVAFIDGVSPAITGILLISPFFFFQMREGFIISVSLAFATLFVLGTYLARICNENLLIHGIKMLGVGIMTAIACLGLVLLMK